MKKLPSLRQLQYLIALYDHQHFGKAAEASFVSQSTLSAAISQLESQFNVILIERQHKKFRFTRLGELVVDKSRKLIHRSGALVDFIYDQSEPMTGSLVLGSIPTIMPFIVRDILTICQKKFPRLQLFAKEMTSLQGLDALASGQLDCLLFALPYETQDFHCQILAQDPFFLTIPKHFNEEQFKQPMSMWPDQSVLLLEDEHCLSQHAIKACTIREKRIIHPFKAASLHTLIEMVAHGMGVTFLPKLAIESGIMNHQNIKLIAQPEEKAYRDLALVWRPQAGRDKTCHTLANEIKNIFATLL